MTFTIVKVFAWIPIMLLAAGISVCTDKEPDTGHEGICIYSGNPLLLEINQNIL